MTVAGPDTTCNSITTSCLLRQQQEALHAAEDRKKDP
jgi:hypothetical protein